MRALFVYFLVLFFSFANAQQKLKLEIELTYIVPDCKDGHNQADFPAKSKTAGLPNTKFYIYQGKKCVDTVKTDANGIVIVKLAPGNYDFFEAWKHFKKTPDGSPVTDFFMDCLQKEWAKPNYQLRLAEEDIKLDYNGVSASRCSNEYACLKVRHLPGMIKRGDK